MPKPLLEMSEREIREAIAGEARHVVYSYNSYLAELDRRAANRQARYSFALSVVGLVVAVAAVLVAVVAAVKG